MEEISNKLVKDQNDKLTKRFSDETDSLMTENDEIRSEFGLMSAKIVDKITECGVRHSRVSSFN